MRTGRPRGRPPKPALAPQPLSVKREPRECLGFGESHYFWSTGPANRRCPECEDRMKQLKMGRRGFEPPLRSYDR